MKTARISLLARRYARALYEAADAAHVVEQTTAELMRLTDLWRTSPELRAAAENTAIPAQKRGAVLQEVAQLGENTPTGKLAALLTAARRLALLPEIVRAWEELQCAIAGKKAVLLELPAPLPPAAVGQLETRLAHILGADVLLQIEIRPELIGGAVVHAGAKMLDGSIRGRLADLRERLLEIQPAGNPVPADK